MTVTARTNALLGSDIIRMQIAELLAQSWKDDSVNDSAVESIVDNIKSAIQAVPDSGFIPIHSAQSRLKKSSRIRIPFVQEIDSDSNLSVAYSKPVQILYGGVSQTQDSENPKPRILYDIYTLIPPHILQGKDYLDYRYFHKRSFYLAWIADGIKQQNGDIKVDIEYFDGNALLPVLLLHHPDLSERKTNAVIRIRPVIQQSQFPLAKTIASRSNIRQDQNVTPQNSGIIRRKPTRFYNATLRLESSYLSNSALLDQVAEGCPAFRDACLLARVWLNRRGLASEIYTGGFGETEWSLLAATLIRPDNKRTKARISNSLDSYGIFRAVTNYLASNEVVKYVPLSKSAEVAEMNEPVSSEIAIYTNIFYKASRWSFSKLQNESKHTISALDTRLGESFSQVFINRKDFFHLAYDVVTRVSSLENKDVFELDNTSEPRAITLCDQLNDILLKGLGDRVRNIGFNWSNVSKKPIKQHSDSNNSVIVGVVVNANNADRLIDRGPLAEDKEACSDFQKFWRGKAELRSFKDGTLRESVVWDSSAQLPVVPQIVNHLLTSHIFAPSTCSIQTFGSELQPLFPEILSPKGTVPNRLAKFFSAFAALETSLREMDDVPLQIRQISPISSHLRFTALPRPENHSSSFVLAGPIEINLLFEGSGRWPDDLAAVQRTKAAFLLKIGECLKLSQHEQYESTVGLEKTDSTLLNSAFLDIQTSSNMMFRLRIHSEKEEQLLERDAKNPSKGSRWQDEASLALETHRREFTHRSRLTQSIKTLATRFPAFPPTAQIVKKWFSSHMLQPYFDEELLEIFCVHAFTNPSPWESPGSAQCGFFRVIHFLAQWDWRYDPLIVDLSIDQEKNNLKSNLNTIREHFDTLRKVGPTCSKIPLFVATNLDHEGICWTRKRPPKVVAARMTALARAADEYLRNSDLQDLDLNQLFLSGTAGFDFVLRINPKFVHLGTQDQTSNSSTPFKNLRAQTHVSESLAKSSVVDGYFQELQARFSSALLFFRDPTSTQLIAALWKPEKPRSWKPNLTYSTKPTGSHEAVEQNFEIEVNRDSVLNDIIRLGGDIVDSLEIL